jgi:hypothetical protein
MANRLNPKQQMPQDLHALITTLSGWDEATKAKGTSERISDGRKMRRRSERGARWQNQQHEGKVSTSVGGLSAYTVPASDRLVRRPEADAAGQQHWLSVQPLRRAVRGVSAPCMHRRLLSLGAFVVAACVCGWD